MMNEHSNSNKVDKNILAIMDNLHVRLNVDPGK